MSISEQEVQDALLLGEQHGTEFKGRGLASDKAFLAKVVRAILAMTNRRDGGLVVVGVDDVNPATGAPGLTPAELAEWTDRDAVRARVAPYVDPFVDFDLTAHQIAGHDVVSIEVAEFADVPVLCGRDYPGTLRKGALYVRSRRMPESVEVPSQTEMREVLDMATEKRLRAFLATAQRAGAAPLAATPAGVAAEDAFAEQAKDFLG